MTKLAVIYYSTTGTNHAIAQAVGEGAQSAGAEVRLRLVAENLPAEVVAKNPKWQAFVEKTAKGPHASLDDLDWADAVVFGTPTRFGNVAAQLKAFIDSAGDLAAFVELPLASSLGLDLDLPVFRPMFFGTSFDMLQFEPSASLRFRKVSAGSIDPIVGPTLGVSLHYGRDYESTNSGAGRRPSFFAVGPILGAYGGLDFKRPGKTFNFQLGVTGYVTPLFSIDDPETHRGVVVGGFLDASFRFRV